MILCTAADTFGQNRRGRPPRPDGSANTSERPAGVPERRPERLAGVSENTADIPKPETVEIGPGTVPQLATPLEKYVPLTVVDPLLFGSVAPDTPNIVKVVRYASHIFEKYDFNQSGFLERDEWSQMPGAPQCIDVDGDFVVSLDELVRFIALYGNVRTIHRPNPPPIPARLNWTTERPSSFQPFSAPLKPKAAPGETKEADQPDSAVKETDENQIVGENLPEPKTEETEKTEPIPPAEGDSTEESEVKTENAENEEQLDDLSYEKVFSEQFKPKERKYFVPLNELRGVPNWFVFRDKNGDGQLTMLEYDPNLSPASLAMFGRLDKNSDGFLTPDEVRVK